MTLPTNRQYGVDGPLDHEADHNALHARYNKAGGGARAVLTANFAIADTLWDDVEWDAEDYDDDSYWEGVTNPERFTVAEAGRYEIGAHLVWPTTPGTLLFVRFQINGAGNYGLVSLTGVTGAASRMVSTAGPFDLSANDYFTVQAFQNTGANLDLVGDATDTNERSYAWIKRLK